MERLRSLAHETWPKILVESDMMTEAAIRKPTVCFILLLDPSWRLTVSAPWRILSCSVEFVRRVFGITNCHLTRGT